LSQEINSLNQLMTYPVNGVRKQDAIEGKWKLDFALGLVTAPDGTSERMSNSLQNLKDQFARSCYISVSDANAQIKVGNNILPANHVLNHVISGLSFDSIEIDFPTGRTPTNDFSFVVIASNSPVFPLQIATEIVQHSITPKTGTTTDAYVDIMDFSFVGYGQSEIIIENTLGVNVLTADIQVSEDGVNYVSFQNYPLNIATNDANLFQSSIAHKFMRVRVKSKVAGNPTDYRIQMNLER
jgi:hypothetical protein